MRSLALLTAFFGLILGAPVPAYAAPLTQQLVADGATNFPCGATNNFVGRTGLPNGNGYVVASYIFVNSNVPTVDVAISRFGAGDGTLADIHKLTPAGFSPGQFASPAWGPGFANAYSGEAYRSFEPDSMFVDTLVFNLNCDATAPDGAPGFANIYLVVWTRDTP
jgi:hypothetical protein